MAAREYASGRWHVTADRAEDFTARWEAFLRWTSDNYDELEQATLLRSASDPNAFVSFAVWGNPEARDAWKHSPGFMERFTACRELCDEFSGGDYSSVVEI